MRQSPQSWPNSPAILALLWSIKHGAKVWRRAGLLGCMSSAGEPYCCSSLYTRVCFYKVVCKLASVGKCDRELVLKGILQ